ncbi:Aste57867_6043 [Aphanomyces stellatus]|uniref:Aste57867_6043 protein n=1 Tax=Aphanomyces stellatus TaxID=120398 RepID=A0A485KFE6_9STRA|nr:hypothetical protein As57867_006029 [Aphanomyces stellatus]VFT83056.1 Aste57867_6043 [Aphanomyces stellatus]
MTLVIVGFLANLLGNPQTLMYFVCYFLFVLLVVFGMLERVFLLRALVVLTNLLCVTTKTRPSPEDVLDDDVLDASTPDSSSQVAKSLNDNVYGNALSLERETGKVSGLWRTIRAIKNAPVVFFIKRADLTTLNKAILYVRANEATHYIWFVHFYTEPTPDAMETVAQLEESVALYNRIYPKIQLELYSVVGEFEPAAVEWISHNMQVPIHSMFLKQPSNTTMHKVSSFGVRVITG